MDVETITALQFRALSAAVKALTLQPDIPGTAPRYDGDIADAYEALRAAGLIERDDNPAATEARPYVVWATETGLALYREIKAAAALTAEGAG